MRWLEQIPWWLIAVAAIAFALVPFGQSHFVEKWRMLFAGTLRRPLDWFDLVMHTTPLALLIAKLVLMGVRASRPD
ncbi:MAG: RND transporter [Thermoanaerobaculia bacterium]